MEYYKNKKNQIRRCLTFCLLLVCLLSFGCNDIAKRIDVETVNAVDKPSPVLEIKQGRTIESKVQKNIKSDWKIIDLRTKETFDQLVFVDDLQGWVMSIGGKLYRTIDGGKSWELINNTISLKPKSYLGDLTFVDSASGWFSLEEAGRNWGDITTKTFHTEDGGVNWTLQSSFEDISISKLVFLNKLEGWAVGSKKNSKEIIYSGFVILHTIDGGKNWIDLSEKLSKFADYQKSNIYGLTDIFVKDSKIINILTDDNRLLESNDKGENWAFVNNIDTGNKTPNFISSPKSGFSIFAGVDSKEGIGSNFLIREENDEWAKKLLPGFYLQDAVYFSENQIFACGSMSTPNPKNKNQSIRSGVVIYSSDNGNNWTIIYQNHNVKLINVIRILKTGHLWIAGDEGFLANNLIYNIVKPTISKSEVE